MSYFVLAGIVVISAVVLVAFFMVCKSLAEAKAQLALELARRKDRDELGAARERTMDAQRESLKREFGELAARLLAEEQRSLTKANEQAVGSLFNQFRERLEKYEQEIAKASSENNRLGEHMKSQLGALQNFTVQAQQFTAALVGGSKIQGNLGEDILAGILEKSGFRKGIEYDTQAGSRDSGRPDLSIYDALNKHVILVDSKMNIKDYITACNLPDDPAHKAEKERALRAHVAGIKKQIDNLADKKYAESIPPDREGYTNLPLVAMFCPFNAVLEAALAEEPSLMQYAYERKIVLVTPLTLWGYFWLVSCGWKQREVERKFDEIQSLGGDVVAALDSLLNDLEEMGKSLRKSCESYDGLYRRATAEKGQISVRRAAQKLMSYGILPPGKLKQLSRE